MMKKLWKLSLCVCVLAAAVCMLTVSVDAEDTDAYRIYGEAPSYTLVRIGAEEEMLAKGELDALFSVLAERHTDTENVTVHLEEIRCARTLAFSEGTYRLTGSLTMTDGARLELAGAAALTLGDMSLSFVESDGVCGYIRIKDGTLVLDGATVHASNTSAIVLDYAAGARMRLQRGRVASTADATILAQTGTVEILGGTVECTDGYAIRSRTTVRLGGEPMLRGKEAELWTDGPVWLSCHGTPLTSSLRICYDALFAKGTAQAVLYDAIRGMESRILLYDAEGAQMPLSYVESMNEESRVLCVSRPFFVRFYADGTCIDEKECLLSQTVSPPDVPERPGYTFDGWYMDAATDTPFSGTVTEDIAVYARYRLCAPTYRLSSLSFVYDGRARTLGFELLEHPLADAGVYQYMWYKDGEVLSEARPSLSLTEVADSGTFRCCVTFTVGNDSASVTTADVTVTVEAQQISPPQLTAVPFTGKVQTAEVAPSAYYTVLENNGGVHAGHYPVRLALNDPENTVWHGSTDTELLLSFVITRAENFFTTPPDVRDCFEGQAPAVTAAAKFGTCKVLFANSADGDYFLDAPTSAGTYFLKVIVDVSDDYDGLISESIAFSVRAVYPEALREVNPPIKTTYTSFDTFSMQGLSVAVVMSDGTERLLPEDELSVTYADGRGCFYAEDAFVFLGYAGLTLPVAVQVERAEYDLSGLVLSSAERVYNGQLQGLLLVGTLPTGRDGHALSVVYEGGGCEVGSYTVYAHFVTESTQYRLPSSLRATLTITPCPVQVTWGVSSFTYNGAYQMPTVTATDLFGQPLALTVTGAACLAGDGYLSYCLSEDANYTVTNDTCPFSIQKAVYDLSDARWSASAFVYNGTVHAVHIEGLPVGVSVLGYTDASATEAGQYTARCTLAYDTVNFEEPPPMTHTYVIAPASYDMTGITFPPCTYVFDGELHYPMPEGSLPVGADGSVPVMHMDTGARYVTDGVVTVTVTFESVSGNYLAPPPVKTTVTVIPLGVTVHWEETDFTYDGGVHVPTASCDTVTVSVSGGRIDAGEYVATAQAADPNYTVINKKCAFTVKKAKNAWLIPLSVDDTFVGTVPRYIAHATVGEVRIAWYADAALTESVDIPTEAGLYYAVASVEGERNHEDMVGEPVSFRMIPVVATALSVTLQRDTFVAFDTVSPLALSVQLVYNDGHTETVASDRVTVTYEHADSLRYGDTSVCIEAEGMSVRCAVYVGKAALPLADAVWSTDGLVYNGREQAVTLQGLAEGITVREYIGAQVTEAGEYTVTAMLDFDRDNYEHVGYIRHTFTVARAEVDLPAVPSDVYCGTLQSARVPTSPLYTVTQSASGCEAGEYTVILTVTDASNYCFADNRDSATLVYRILPRPITVTVEDVYVYTDQKTPEVAYRISEGELCEGDALSLAFAIVGDTLTATASNPDYDVTFSLGRVILTGRLSPERRSIVWLLALLVLLLLLSAYLLWRFRGRIRYAVHKRTVRMTGAVAALPCIPPALPSVQAEPPTEDIPVVQPTAEEMSFADACRAADALLSIYERPRLSVDVPVPCGEASVPEDSTAHETPKDERVVTEDGVEAAICAVDVERADTLISDDLAGHLLVREPLTISTFGRRRVILNVDVLSRAFAAGDRVDVNILKEKYLIPYDTGYLKILAGGILDKALEVYADSFSLQAVKMIALTGGHAVRAMTVSHGTPKKKKTAQKAQKSIEKITTL